MAYRIKTSVTLARRSGGPGVLLSVCFALGLKREAHGGAPVTGNVTYPNESNNRWTMIAKALRIPKPSGTGQTRPRHPARVNIMFH